MTSQDEKMQKPSGGCGHCGAGAIGDPGRRGHLEFNAKVQHNGDDHVLAGWSCAGCRRAYKDGGKWIHQQEHSGAAANHPPSPDLGGGGRPCPSQLM